jgi:hypothetical protein
VVTGRFTPVVRALGTHWLGGWVGSRAGLDDVEKRKSTLPGFELPPAVLLPLLEPPVHIG